VTRVTGYFFFEKMAQCPPNLPRSSLTHILSNIILFLSVNKKSKNLACLCHIQKVASNKNNPND
jgi:hypothetical protein